MSQSVTRPPAAELAASARTEASVPRCWPISPSVDRTDRHRVLTLFAVAGLFAGALMAAYGLPPIDMHGPLHHMGIMGPTCGGTRSVRFAMMGEWGMSLRYNPIGIPLVLCAAFLVLRTAVGAATGRWLNVRITWTRPLVVVIVLAVAALWVNQQLHVELIGP